MPSVSLISACGGVGRSTLTAALASETARAGHWSLALECDPQNLLALHFGAEQAPADGLMSRSMKGRAWNTAALRAADGTLVLPFGALDADLLGRCMQRMLAEPDWLATRLAALDRPAAGWVWLDTARAPSVFATEAVRASDAVLLVLRADPVSLSLLEPVLASLPGKPLAAVVNQYEPERSGQAEILASLQQRLGAALAPFPLPRSEALLTAFLARLAPADQAPDDPYTTHLRGLLQWLRLRFGREGGAPVAA